MAGLMYLLSNGLEIQIIFGVSWKVGVSKGETLSILSSLMLTIVGVIQNSASTPDGISSMLRAPTSGKHDGVIPDNLSGFLGGNDC